MDPLAEVREVWRHPNGNLAVEIRPMHGCGRTYVFELDEDESLCMANILPPGSIRDYARSR